MTTELRLPAYANPPLDEVVLGATFTPLSQFKTPYIGLFWDRIRSQFPRCEQAPVIGNIDEVIEPEVGLPAPRIWLINQSDDHLIQIQKNKLLFNWRKRREAYPRYEAVFAGFTNTLQTFTEFVIDNDLGDINIINYEMSYINIIPRGNGWSDLNSISDLFPDFHWRKGPRLLSNIESVLWHTAFSLPQQQGTLVMQIQTASRRIDNYPLLRLEFTASGLNNDLSSGADAKRWFDMAHEWIVRSFEDVSSEDAQREIWRKYARDMP